jgi:hypothetical protein
MGELLQKCWPESATACWNRSQAELAKYACHQPDSLARNSQLTWSCDLQSFDHNGGGVVSAGGFDSFEDDPLRRELFDLAGQRLSDQLVDSTIPKSVNNSVST